MAKFIFKIPEKWFLTANVEANSKDEALDIIKNTYQNAEQHPHIYDLENGYSEDVNVDEDEITLIAENAS